MAKRRPAGDGMVRRRDDGRWEGRIVIEMCIRDSSDSMVRHIHSTLHAALKDAVQAHVIPRNPTEGTTAPKPNYKPKRILTRAELDDFLTVVEPVSYTHLD